MNTSSRRLTSILALLVITLALFVQLPLAQAYDSAKIVLPAVSDKSGYDSPELNAALLSKLRSQFRFPRYETILTSAMNVAPDRSALEKITADNGADGTVAVEINYLRTQMYNGFFVDETYEDTYLTITLTYFDKKTGQYGQFKTNRSAIEISSVYSGPLPLAMNAMEELLNRLDKIFPRQFSGPRY